MTWNNCFVKSIKKYKMYYFIGILSVIFVDCIQLWIPEITGDITDQLQQQSITIQDMIPYMLQLLLIGIGMTIGRFVWRLCIFGTSRYVEREIRNIFFGKLLRLPQKFYNKSKTGDMMAHATNDVSAVRMMAGPGILMILDTIVLTTMVIYKMITYVDVRLTLFAIIPMPLIAINSIFTGKAIRKRFKEKQDAFSELSDLVQENISGIRVIKAFVQESMVMKEFEKINQKNFKKNMKVIWLQALMQPFATIVVAMAIVLVIGFGGYMAMIGTITVGNLVAFIQYLFMLIWPMIALGWGVNIYSQGMASLNRIETVLQVEESIKDEVEVNWDLKLLEPTIELRDLHFEYDEAIEVIQGISVSVEKGQTIGIIGRTGSGKSTVVNLLSRLYNPPKNQIFIGGHEIYTIPLQILRKHVVYVPQENFLFSESIAKNIAFSNHEIQQEEIIDAAKSAAVHDSIIDFSEGYDTVIGEKGVMLSGGQKQRVSMARAFVTEAPILILDDAVSAVDTHTEDVILKQLKELRNGKTTLIIAHRISTISHVDQIWFFDQGKIVEAGTHQELMDKQGYYFELNTKQQLEKEIDSID